MLRFSRAILAVGLTLAGAAGAQAYGPFPYAQHNTIQASANGMKNFVHAVNRGHPGYAPAPHYPVGHGAYPLTAPASMALENWRWKRRNTMIVGAMISSDPALRSTTSRLQPRSSMAKPILFSGGP